MNCVHPIYIKRPYSDANGFNYWEVPCGKCLACRINRSKSWAIRLMLESLSWSDSVFLTLTYNDAHLPLGEFCPTLVPEHLRNFWKRLRKMLRGRKIKYYAVGEYGDHTKRPHYHAIVFGLSVVDLSLVQECWRKDGEEIGYVDCGDVTLASCNYVAGYIQKKLYGDEAYLPGQIPPFSRMSKGIGKQYLIEHHEELLRDGFIRYRSMKISIPRYFWKLAIDDGLLPKSTWSLLRSKSSLVQRARSAEELSLMKAGFSPEQYGIEKARRLHALAVALRSREKFNDRGKI